VRNDVQIFRHCHNVLAVKNLSRNRSCFHRLSVVFSVRAAKGTFRGDPQQEIFLVSQAVAKN